MSSYKRDASSSESTDTEVPKPQTIELPTPAAPIKANPAFQIVDSGVIIKFITTENTWEDINTHKLTAYGQDKIEISGQGGKTKTPLSGYQVLAIMNLTKNPEAKKRLKAFIDKEKAAQAQNESLLA